MRMWEGWRIVLTRCKGVKNGDGPCRELRSSVSVKTLNELIDLRVLEDSEGLVRGADAKLFLKWKLFGFSKEGRWHGKIREEDEEEEFIISNKFINLPSSPRQ